ncbi:MAG: FHA domain-containing protein [Gemmatales bacterium]|nr:FHA domain-containing protein [Gemmatales bacterium]MDW7993159.1 FHA domain-containing protein [Gemmatales bacterium]
MRIYLIPADGSRPFELVKDITLVGRSRVCDLQLLDKSVSKLHCVLVKTDHVVLVRDLGSTNGTRVKDILVKRGVLIPGDELVIARLRFRVHFAREGESLPQPREEWIRTEQMPLPGLQAQAPSRREDFRPEPPVFPNLRCSGQGDISQDLDLLEPDIPPIPSVRENDAP